MNFHEEEHNIVIQSITGALFELMDNKPFSEITVTELIKKAGVARSTYYRNFDSKEAIIKLFFNNLFQEFNQKYPVTSIEDRYSEQYIDNILEFLIPYTDTAKVLIKAGVANFYLTMLNEHLMKLYKTTDMSIDESFRIYTIAGAEYNLIFNWYVNEQHCSTDEIKRYLSEKKHYSFLKNE